MCGIAGFINKLDHEHTKEISNVISQNIAHRGPDDKGVEIISLDNEQNLSLIHRRLSIIDISKLGHQPMFDDKNKNWIIFNGEIYNFENLRSQLVTDNYFFKSNSDTEVLLHAYDKWGLQLLDKIEGMFGFAIWDNSKQELFIAVDPLGIKPIYWNVGSDSFCFSSELRSLIKSGLVKKNLNKNSLDNFLAYGSVQGPETIISDLNLLQGGNYLRVNKNGSIIEHKKYWNLNFKDKTTDSRENIIQSLENNLSLVTKEHLNSDVPIGIFLSGGIDSTALAYLASKNKKSLYSFSVTFDEKEWAEGNYAEETAHELGIKHTELVLSPSDLNKSITSAMNSLDQPSIDGTNVYIISKLVRAKGIKVALSGQGGDEIFGGYRSFRDIPRAVKIDKFLRLLPSSIRKIMSVIWSLIFNFKRKIPSKIKQFLEQDSNILDNYLLSRQILPFETRRKLFPLDVKNKIAINENNKMIFLNETKFLQNIDSVSYLELNLYLGQTLLRDGDVMGMANGLEIRVPYLDRRIVQFMCSVPSKFKLEKYRPKPLLLDAVKKGVNKKTWDKKKQGFTFPWHHWLKNELKYLGDEAFNDKVFWNKTGFNYNEVKNVWKFFQKDKGGVSWASAWLLIVFRKWYIINID